MQRVRKCKSFRDTGVPGQDRTRAPGPPERYQRKEITTMTRKLVRATLFVFALTMSVARLRRAPNPKPSRFTRCAGQREDTSRRRIHREVRYHRLQRPGEVPEERQGSCHCQRPGEAADQPSRACPGHHAGSGSARTISEIDFSHSGTGVTFDAGSMSAGSN